jgi:glucose-1-phosphate adenylyltransferase
MDFRPLIEYHVRHQADTTIASLQVPPEEASRFGILGVDGENRVTSFVEKPKEPLSNLANMGVYLFNTKILDRALWEDRDRTDSFHDFGKDILPQLVDEGKKVYSFPYSGYWVDVGTDESYWSAHMDLLKYPPPINLNDRSWIIHTRTEERPPSRFARGSTIMDCLVSDGCYIAPGAVVERSVLSPGVVVLENARIFESVILTDTVVKQDAQVAKSILDKRVTIEPNARIGSSEVENPKITIIGKNSIVMPGMLIEPGAIVGSDVVDLDYSSAIVRSDDFIQTRRLPYEI